MVENLSYEISKLKHEATEEEEVEMVTITKAEYEGLLEDADKLARLEAYGVDNWSGYSDAMSDEGSMFE